MGDAAAADQAQCGRILVVDDAPDVLRVVSLILSRVGYEVEGAGDGTTALELLSKRRFDLVISDLRMPGIEGTEVLEGVRRVSPDTDVLMMSGAGSIHDAVDAMKLGARGFLVKPFSAEALVSEVRTIFTARAERTLATPPGRRGSASTGFSADGAPPRTIGGRYRLDRVIGRGGMGAVFEAFDSVLDRAVAVKSLIPREDIRGWENVVRRFRREGWVAGRLAHPHIVSVYDFVEEDGNLYLVMELVRGKALSERLKSEGRFPVSRAVSIAHQTAEALSHAHSMSIIHRDVKPANILLQDGDFVKLVDFGIAKVPVSDLTEHGAWVGSPGYCAPEMLGGGKVDYRADQFSLGTVLLEMLSGVSIFYSASPFETYRMVKEEEPPSLEELGIAVPESLQHILRRLHSKNPEERYADEGDLLLALSSVFPKESAQAPS